jgi:hypothetical protein
MIFHNINLVWLTCIQKFEVPLQVVNRTWFNLIFKEGFEFKIELETKMHYRLHYRDTIEHCSCYSDTRGVTSFPP